MNFCALCETSQTTEKLYDRNNYSVVRCNACGLVFSSPMPSSAELETYYLKHESQLDIESYTQRPGRSFFSRYIQDSRKRRDFRILKSFEKIQKCSGKILDIGCGIGTFLKHAKERGWKSWGVDIDAKRIQYGKNHFGLNLFCGHLHEAKFPNETFDVITLRNLLDHLASPLSFLREIRRILKPEGLIFINVHDIGGWRAKKFKENWNALWPPLHLHYFSYQTLEKMLEKAGLKFYRVPGLNLKEGIKLLTVKQNAPFVRTKFRKQFEESIYTLVQKLHL